MLDDDGEEDILMRQLWRYAVAGNIKKRVLTKMVF